MERLHDGWIQTLRGAVTTALAVGLNVGQRVRESRTDDQQGLGLSDCLEGTLFMKMARLERAQVHAEASC